MAHQIYFEFDMYKGIEGNYKKDKSSRIKTKPRIQKN